jgi:hypothetical protein
VFKKGDLRQWRMDRIKQQQKNVITLGVSFNVQGDVAHRKY